MTDAYDDGRIAIDAVGVTIRRFYFPTGQAKRIAFAEIRGVEVRPIRRTERFRIWGSASPRQWFPLDLTRPRRSTAVVLDLGRRVRPVLTPDDPERVAALLRDRGAGPSR